nr:MAG TPA: hypothetical protein [Caudoviricetes sp.]
MPIIFNVIIEKPNINENKQLSFIHNHCKYFKRDKLVC